MKILLDIQMLNGELNLTVTKVPEKQLEAKHLEDTPSNLQIVEASPEDPTVEVPHFDGAHF